MARGEHGTGRRRSSTAQALSRPPVRFTILLVSATCVAALGAGAVPAQANTPNERANALVVKMSLKEKLGLVGTGTGIPRLGIPAISFVDGPNGVGEGTPGVTAFPDAVNIGASWDIDLAASYGTALGTEARAAGHTVIGAPTLNIVRTPKWGRAAETYSEDPLLTSALVAPEVLGIQSATIMAQPKHYAANNQEIGRLGVPLAAPGVDVQADQRTLQEIYFPGFKAAVQQGGAASVMCSYNRINGVQSCQDHDTLSTLKRAGLQGWVGPDALLAVRDIATASNAGVDNFTLGSAFGNEDTLKAAVKNGTVPLSRLDDSARRIVLGMIRVGLVGAPAAHAQSAATSDLHRKLATTISTAGTVLLQNNPAGRSTQPVLPLTAADRSVAVIGYDAGEGTQTEEGGSPAVLPGAEVVTPLAGLRARAPEGTTVSYAPGTRGVVALPVVPASVLTPDSGTGHGLSGALYGDRTPTFQGAPVATRVDKTLDFASDFAPLRPIPGTSAYSGRWTGTLTPPTTGQYRFSLSQAGIAKLFIDGKLIAGGDSEGVNFGPQFPGAPDQSFQGLAQLTAGKPVPVTVEYATDASIGGAALHLGWQPPEPALRAAAVDAARHADVAVVFVNDVTSEGMDRPSLSLPADQDQLIEAVAAANPRTVVVLHTASAVLMPWKDKVAGIVEAWYPGQQSGTAIAQTLYGDVDPSGRLPVTFPASETQGPTAIPERYPGINNVAQYSEGVFVGYRYYDQFGQTPLFPFGYGLSYTSFALSDLQVTAGGSGGYDTTAVVRNTGRRAGTQVVQVYVDFPAGLGEPPRQLKAFAKVALEPGQTKTVHLHLDRSSFQHFDDSTGSWQTTAGTYGISVGTSSRDLALATSVRLG